MSRSFTGCKRCKARRQKCDELRPECSRCKASGVQCRYTMQLQWGGRAFSRSRFGACVGPAMQKLEYSPGQFIYTTVKAESASPAEASNCLPSASTSPCSPVAVYPSSAQELDPFSFLSSRQKWLLQHFVRDASGATSCHDGMQQEICRMIVPMALQTPSLLYATMALSAIHIEALNSPHPGTVKAAADVANLMARSLEHFRLELQESPRRDSDLLLATARTLCLAEIHSGAILPNTWRAHVEGAKALMSTASDSSYSPTTSLRKYLDRWYRSIVALAALNGNGPPIGEARPCATYTTSDDLDYLDDYWGFTINLADVFREIGVVAWRRRHETRPRSSSTRFLDPLRGEDAIANFDEEAARLEDLVLGLMARHNQDGGLLFYPGVKEKLSEQSIREFKLCNEAFQHTALIHIHRRVRKAPATAPEVQYSVQRILACTSEIVPKTGLSPWVMLTTPLFTGGCEALDEDRAAFKQLLLSLYQTTRIPNVLQSLRFLEDYWAHGNQNEEKDWSHFLDRMNLDFIPY